MEELTDMLLKIDKTRPVPVYKQIISQVKTLIEEGVLAAGHALPSTRALARKLGINRSTVYLAYEELQAQGYLESRPGSYNIVFKRRKEVSFQPESRSIISWDKLSSGRANDIYETFLRFSPERCALSLSGQRMINLAALDLDPRLYPVREFRKCVNQVLRSFGPGSLEYGAHRGYKPLRNYISQRLRLHGISVSEEEILITNGAQQAIDLIIRVLAGKEKKAVVESPTYAQVIPLLKYYGMKIIGIPMKEDGMDLAALERVLKKGKIRFVYTIPNFQNPTGLTSTHAHREKLLGLCLEHKVPIIEDGFEEEMKYFGRVDLPIKSMDEKKIVIYLGTFSKALFPGLRIGWVAADKEFIERATAIKRFSDLTSNNFAQVVMSNFCTGGFYDLHLKRLHRAFRKRMLAALESMDKHFPDCVRWTRPVGGYTIWVKLPRKFTEKELGEFLSPYGITVSHGSYYFPKPGPSEYFRVSIASLNEEEIREGIVRLGKALKNLLKISEERK